jgi:hypothetical protein
MAGVYSSKATGSMSNEKSGVHLQVGAWNGVLVFFIDMMSQFWAAQLN